MALLDQFLASLMGRLPTSEGAANAGAPYSGLPAPDKRSAPSPMMAPQPSALPDASPATYLAGALRGASAANNPIGMLLGGLGGAIGAGGQVDQRNQLYKTLMANGMSGPQAALFVQSPEAYKLVAGGGGATTDDLREYEFAKRQGFDGSYLDFQSKMSEIRRAGKVDPMEVMLKRDELQRQRDQNKSDDKRMAEVRSQGDTGRGLVDKLGRLRDARAGVSYEGGIAPNLRTWLGRNLPDGPSWLGLPGVPSQQEAGRAEEVQSLGTEIQLLFTQQTKGAISNREMDLFGQATPGMSMSDAGAQNVINGMEAGAIRAREKPKFFEAWRKKNGTLDGADAAWDSFVETTPIIIPDGQGGFTVNKSNAIAWQRFLDPNAAAASQGSTAAPGAAPGATPGAAQAPAAPAPGARQAPDGNWYMPDPNRPGKYLLVKPDANGVAIY